ALVEAGERLTAVDAHVGAGGILQKTLCAAAGALAPRRDFRDARPQRAARGLFLDEAVGAHEAVAERRASILEAHRAQQAVAVEGMVAAERLMERVLGVAEIHAGEVAGNLAFDVAVL